jgi:uncharacterized protein
MKAVLIVAAVAALVLSTHALAAGDASERTRATAAELALLSSPAFTSIAPDHRWRLRGSDAYSAGRHEVARSHFTRAAHFADKLSQAMLAEMHWKGQGGPQDRAAAYAWMDLAAERGYPHLLAKREHIWEQLTTQEQQQALTIGRQLYAAYGDDVAKPRMEAALRRARMAGTGSRVGASVGTRVIEADGPSVTLSNLPYVASQLPGFYDGRQWDPDRYWALVDRAYGTPTTAPSRAREREIRREVPLRRQGQ